MLAKSYLFFGSWLIIYSNIGINFGYSSLNGLNYSKFYSNFICSIDEWGILISSIISTANKERENLRILTKKKIKSYPKKPHQTLMDYI